MIELESASHTSPVGGKASKIVSRPHSSALAEGASRVTSPARREHRKQWFVYWKWYLDRFIGLALGLETRIIQTVVCEWDKQNALRLQSVGMTSAYVIFHSWCSVPVQVRAKTQTYHETYRDRPDHHGRLVRGMSLPSPCSARRPTPSVAY
jgi:hypothetical protein